MTASFLIFFWSGAERSFITFHSGLLPLLKFVRHLKIRPFACPTLACFQSEIRLVFRKPSPIYMRQSFFKRMFTFTIFNGQSSLVFFSSISSVFFFFDVDPSIQKWHQAVLYYILFFGNVFMSGGVLLCAVTELPTPLLNVTVDTRASMQACCSGHVWKCLHHRVHAAFVDFYQQLSPNGWAVVAQRLGCCHCCGSC